MRAKEATGKSMSQVQPTMSVSMYDQQTYIPTDDVIQKMAIE